MKKEAQVSMEYMMVIGFSLLIIMPIIVLFFMNYDSFIQNINAHQAGKVTRTIVHAAEKVYYIGEPAQTIVKVNMPQRIEDISIQGKYLLMKVRFETSLTEVYEISAVNLTGNISLTPGIKQVLVQAHEQYVNITEIY